MCALINDVVVSLVHALEGTDDLCRFDDHTVKLEKIVITHSLQGLRWPVQEPVDRGAIDE